MYPPLVLQTGQAFPFLIFAIHFLGISSIMGAINIIATVFNMRAPGMSLMQMPLFVWTWGYYFILINSFTACSSWCSNNAFN
jgi:cytochrome c oxidase subunit 1